jgi:hypothetical protein
MEFVIDFFDKLLQSKTFIGLPIAKTNTSIPLVTTLSLIFLFGALDILWFVLFQKLTVISHNTTELMKNKTERLT